MKKKRILLGLSAFALVGLATVLSSCDGDKKYTVKFVDGQQEITKTEVTGGYNVAVPEAPTADGKTFNGWYKDAALTDPFDFGSIINGDTTVYAAWLNEYGVTFKSGDATYLIKPVTKGYNVAVPTAPTKEGYVFAGWYADAAFTTPFYFGTVIEADTTVYAKWISNAEPVQTYSITYVTEKGTAPATVEGVTSLPETLPSLTADGFTFGGWYLDQSFETAAAAGTALTQNVTLYAKWTQNQAPVTTNVLFDATELTTGDTYVADTTLDTTEEKAEVTAEELVNGFFTVVGEGKVQKRSKQYKVGDVKHYSSECVAIEAQADTGLQFTVSSNVKVTLSLQSTSSTNKSIFALTKDDAAVAAKNASDLTQNATANHYVITGSSVEVVYELEAGTYKMMYLNEKAAEADSSTVNRGGRFFSIKVEGNTPAATYSVTYDANGHGEAPAALTNATALPETLPTLTATGFRFVGWATTANATEANVTAGAALSANTTLYAVWEELQNAVTVSFVTGVDSITLAQAQTEKGGKLTALPTLADTVTNYVIEGFFTDENYNTPFTLDTEVADDMNVYVKLKAVYTVSFETSKGTAPDAILRQTKITVADLPTLANVGYFELKGWLLDGTLVTEDVQLTEDSVLVASWVQVGYEVDDVLNITFPDGFEYPYVFEKGNPVFTTDGFWANDNTANVRGTYNENKTILIHDESADDTLYAYVIPGMRFDGGKFVINVDMKLKANGGKWSIMHLLDSKKQNAEGAISYSVFAIGANNEKNFSYSLNGTNDILGEAEKKDNADNPNYVAPINKVAVEANKVYSVVITVDFDNKKISYSVDGKAICEVAVDSLDGIDGFCFQTAKSATNRDITISKLTYEYFGTTTSFATQLGKNLDAFVTTLDLDTKYTTNKAAILAKATELKEEFATITDYDQLLPSYEAAKKTLLAFESDAQIALREAKEAALKDITDLIKANTFNMYYEYINSDSNVPVHFDSYDEFFQYILSDVYDLTDKTTIASVEAQRDAVLASIAQNTDTSNAMKQTYLTYKITGLKATFEAQNYTETGNEGDYNNLTAYNFVMANIDSLAIANFELDNGKTYKENCDDSFASASQYLSTVKTNATLLSEAKTNYTAQIENYRTTDIEALDSTVAEISAKITEIENKKTTAKTTISEATGVAAVQQAYNETILSVDSLIQQAQGNFREQLDTDKTNATATINAYENVPTNIKQSAINQLSSIKIDDSVEGYSALQTAYNECKFDVDKILGTVNVVEYEYAAAGVVLALDVNSTLSTDQQQTVREQFTTISFSEPTDSTDLQTKVTEAKAKVDLLKAQWQADDRLVKYVETSKTTQGYEYTGTLLNADWAALNVAVFSNIFANTVTLDNLEATEETQQEYIDTQVGVIKAKSYKIVSFDSNNTITIAAIEGVLLETKVSEPVVDATALVVENDGVRTTYTIDGYYKTYEAGVYSSEFDFTAESITADTTIYVKTTVTKTEYKVEFVSEKGTDDQWVEAGSKVTALTTLSSTTQGLTTTYEILGYYSTKAENVYSDEFDLDTTISAVKTIYVKARASKYEYVPTSEGVTFNGDVAHAGIFTVTVKKDTPADLAVGSFNFGGSAAKLEFDLPGNVKADFSVEANSTSTNDKGFGLSISKGTTKIDTNVVTILTETPQTPVDYNFAVNDILIDSENKSFAISRIGGGGIKLTKLTIDLQYEFTVEYDDMNDATADNEVRKVAVLGKAENLSPVANGTKTFVGWYLNKTDAEAANANVYDFNTPISSNLTLYAGWDDAIYYTVTYVIDGVTNATFNVKENDVISNSQKPSNPIKQGYIFAGWFTSLDNGQTLSETTFDFATEISGDLELYAKWYDVVAGTKTTIQFGTSSQGELTVTDSSNIVEFYVKNSSDAWDSTYNGIKLGGETKSGTRYIKVVAPSELTIRITLSTAGSARSFGLESSLQKYTGTDNTVAKNSSDVIVEISVPDTGTYYINSSGGGVYINKIEVVMPDITVKTMTATVVGGVNKITLSDVTLKPLDSNVADITSGFEYEVYLDDLTTKATVTNGEITAEPGTHKVTIKYGSYTVLEVNDVVVLSE